MTKYKNMGLIIFLAIWLLCGSNAVLSITVSPDLGLRNASTVSEQIIINNITKENDMSLADRYRRLIPYMTFYIPNDFPINEQYNYMQMQMQHYQHQQQQQQQQNSQQKPIIAVFHSQPQHSHYQQQQSSRLQQQQQQQQKQESIPQHNIQNLRQNSYVQQRYPNNRPQYQAIVYNTRHQTANQIGNHNINNNNDNNNNNHNHHHLQMGRLSVPLSFKETNFARLQPIQHRYPSSSSKGPFSSQQQHSTTKLNLTPFTPTNKIPGQFTPIIYTEDINSINYNDKPQIDVLKQHQQLQQFNDILDGQSHQEQHHNDQQEQRPLLHSLSTVSSLQPPSSLSSIQPTLVSSSPSPLYPIYNDLGHQPASPQQHQQVVIQTPELTPEEKYVAYLQQKQKQQHENQKSEMLHTQPEHQSSFIQVIKPSPSPQPNNHILYHDKQIEYPVKQIVYHQSTSAGGQNEEVYHQPTQKPSHYRNENNQNYLEYTESEQNRNVPQTPQVSSIKPILYITTATPIHVTSAGSIYKTQRQQQQKILHPQNQYIIHQPQKEYVVHQQKHKDYQLENDRPIYVSSPKPPHQDSIRQHLTETTQEPPPILTTYHPANYPTQKPKFDSFYSTIRPQKFKPIVVTKPVPEFIPKTTQSNDGEQNGKNDEPFPDIHSSSLAEILRKLQESNHLPQTLTPDNIDNSIRTLIKILNNLKQSQTIVENPPQHHDDDYDYDDSSGSDDPQSNSPGPNSGRPGIDYPALAEIPATAFNCKEQRYKGFFGDPETSCQVWHYCDLNGGQASFLCPNGTIFSQVALTCDWWFNVKCSSTAQLYVLNERLYKYILPFTPKFPEDYSGPLVDKYLALKFKEMEEKMRKQKLKGKMKSDEETDTDDVEVSATEENMEKGSENVALEDIDENDDHSSIDTGLPYPSSTTTATPSSTAPSLSSSTTEQEEIITFNGIMAVTSTATPFIPPSTSTKPKVMVESEKVEVIEIKSDGSSGHLIPSQLYNSRQ